MLEQVIPKPTGFFERGYLEELRGVFDPFYRDEQLWKMFMANDPSTISRQGTSVDRKYHHLTFSNNLANFARELERVGINPRYRRFCDIGSGNGYVVAAFSLHDCPAYGIEINAELIQDANRRFKFLPLQTQPVLLNANYYDKTEREEFEDGTKFRDIDLFFCNSYDYDGLRHARRVLVQVLAGPTGAKKGSIAYITSWWNPTDTLLDRIGFKPIMQEGSLTTKMLQKTKSVDLPEEFIRSFDF